MFDVGWSELLIIGIVALLVVGPKELPALLRTIGRYMGTLRRQANEFRAQFDEAMRETEFEQLRKDVEAIKSDAETSLRSAEHSVQSEIAQARTELDSVALAAAKPPESIEHQPDVAGTEPAKITDARTDGSPSETDGSSAPEQDESKPAVNGSAVHAYNGAGVDTGGTGGEQPARAGRETQ